ncbi:Aldehyde dehydrogenase, thermostable [Labrenzia sp. THAF82]|uniref:aldehyde dehydrogenase family protein n=1 Tax=Labrenzia sp. THAF82 TaxID=2587861 RepID=UPI0012688612|nr:aldehyde dehydrogenase family protein [Labrenzia sp. THAF82]QFT33349.1 Aldehyde dehydrogenase, thermostable [Labrenzia sp. THAF82]
MMPLLIDGAWVTTAHAEENRNPSNTNDVIDLYAHAGRAETQAAIEAAARAVPAWASTTPQFRFDILNRVADQVIGRKTEIGTLLSREEGKTLREGIAETERAANIFRFFAGECLRQAGELLPSVRPGVSVEVTREPLGVIGIITPWNFPMAIPSWKIAPALCYGNTVVFKPAELVPGCAWVLADILQSAGVPKGVFNLVTGQGSVVGNTILEAENVEAVTFTGSQGVGSHVAQACIRHMRKLQLEMGGKNPLVVLDDADLDLAVDCAVDGAFYSTGQRCTASSRLIVTEGIYGRFIEKLTERCRALKVGDALDAETDIGPVASAAQLETDLKYIEIARAQGGNLRAGGDLVKGSNEGYFLRPALFTDTTNDMRINREEVFGPVASVIRVRDFEEALATANDTEFGLCSGIMTTSLRYASQFRKESRAGVVMVNLPTAGVDYHVPFGGRKSSSYGPREQGRYAAEFFSTVKTSYIRA